MIFRSNASDIEIQAVGWWEFWDSFIHPSVHPVSILYPSYTSILYPSIHPHVVFRTSIAKSLKSAKLKKQKKPLKTIERDRDRDR